MHTTHIVSLPTGGWALTLIADGRKIGTFSENTLPELMAWLAEAIRLHKYGLVPPDRMKRQALMGEMVWER